MPFCSPQQYPKVFLDLMMVDELGIQPDDGDENAPLKQGIMMFASFITFGAVPLLAYIPNEAPWAAFMISCFLTMMCLAVLGMSTLGHPCLHFLGMFIRGVHV